MQVKLFKDLRSLLEIKRKVAMTGGDDGYRGYQDQEARGYERFVVQ